MKKLMYLAFVTIGLSAATCLADPYLSSAVIEQNPDNALVTVKYTLAQDAVVTLAVETNRGDDVWVPIGDVFLTNAVGDVNRLFAAGPDQRLIMWQPQMTWPNRKITGGNLRVGVKAWSPKAPPDYMVVSLLEKNVVRYYPSAEAVPDGVQARKYKTDYMVFRKIPAAGVQFWMGPQQSEVDAGFANANELPRHLVSFTNDYYMAIYECTQRQYLNMRNDVPNPSAFNTGDWEVRPVESKPFTEFRSSSVANWPSKGHGSVNGAVAEFRSRRFAVDDLDLPTEARWEFACRAGCANSLYDGHELSTKEGECSYLNKLAWYTKNSGGTTHEVGTREPNAWGLYDILGNVFEACLDQAGSYSDSPAIDPVGPDSSSASIVLRGGSHQQSAWACRTGGRRLYQYGAEKCSYYGYRFTCDAIAHY